MGVTSKVKGMRSMVERPPIFTLVSRFRRVRNLSALGSAAAFFPRRTAGSWWQSGAGSCEDSFPYSSAKGGPLLGFLRPREKAQKALETVYAERKTLTRDVGGTAGTSQFTDAVLAAMS